MFTIGELFGILHYGELRGVEEGGAFIDECGVRANGIKPDDYPKLISHINLGLINLYTKFPILEKELLVKMVKNQVTYLLDTPDLIRINAIHDECGRDIPLNDEHDCESIWTPTFNVLQVPQPEDGKYLSITYRANHTNIPLDTTDLTTEIHLPHTLYEALVFYVTSRLHSSRANGQELSNIYLSRYYNRIAEVSDRNVFGTNSNTTNLKLRDNGWV